MRRVAGIGMAVMLSVSMLCSCGTTAADTEKTEGVSNEAVASDASDIIVGTYLYQEEAMGGQLIIDWTLELKEDGTYALTEAGPMGDTVHEGTYSYDGKIVTTGPFEGDVQAIFFEADKSCKWILDGNTCTPVSAGDGSAEVEAPVKTTNATYADVAYASNSDSQVCDIYLPEEEGTHPVIIVYHGGGFMFGDQGMEIIQPIIESAVDHGYAVVSADYRKASEDIFPAAVSDAKAVVRFVKANAGEYGFDTEHIAVWGESAGAYLAAMTALTPGVETLDGDVTDNADQDEIVTALVDFYGPIEFYTMDDEYKEMGQDENAVHTKGSFESAFLGMDDMSSDKDVVYASYWESYEDAVPTDLVAWIQAGTGDVQVPNIQSQNFAERLSAVIGENNVEFSLIEGAGHEDDKFYTDENLDQVFEFLDSVMK